MATPPAAVDARPIAQCRDTYGALEVLADLADGEPVDQACKAAAIDAASRFTEVDTVVIRPRGLEARRLMETRNDWDLPHTLVPRFGKTAQCPKDLPSLLACTLPAFVTLSDDTRNTVERYLDAQVAEQAKSQSARDGYTISCRLVIGAGLQSGIVCTEVKVQDNPDWPGPPAPATPRGPCTKTTPPAL